MGEFEIFDFSELPESGFYLLRAGESMAGPFAIGPDVWRPTIAKVLNYFYSERCGDEIPGIHGACHPDWQAVHGDKRMIINGGWHEAGDLSQGLVNTAEAAYAMFSLAGRLGEQQPKLAERLIEEACRGLRWILKKEIYRSPLKARE